MITYFLNWMGPISNEWYEDSNIPFTYETKFSKLLDKDITSKQWSTHYACGRIDIDGVPNEPYGLEYGIGVMETSSWNKFADWLSELSTIEVWSKEKLIETFENELGNIKWLNKLVKEDL